MTLETQVLALRLMLIVGLYLFLVAVLIVAWRELRAGAAIAAAAAQPVSRRRLVVVEAGDSPLQPGDTFPLRPVTSMGRDLANSLVLPDSGVSAEHALISARDGHWWLEDLASTNGTFLNGVRLRSPAIIAPGDVIRVGYVQLKLE